MIIVIFLVELFSAFSVMTLTNRDLEILCFVLAFDGCTTSLLRDRFWPTSARTTAHARLARLVAAKYLRALRLPPIANRGSGQFWFTLGPTALPLLSQALGLTAAERKQLRHSSLPPCWQHEVSLRDTRLRLELAIEQSTLVTLEGWEMERSLRKKPIRVNDVLSHETVELVPDSAFSLVTADGRSYRFLVELDRGSLVSVQRFLPKLRAHLQHSEARAVLFVVPGAARATQISRWATQAARQLDVSPHVFWLTPSSELSAETALTRPIWNVVGKGKAALLSAFLPAQHEHPIYQRPAAHDDVNLQ